MEPRLAEELSVRELRAELADVINAAGTRGEVTFVTNHGRRVAAVVSVAVGERAAADAKAEDDGSMAGLYATNVAIIEDRGGIPGRTMAEVFEEYAADLLREFGGSVERILAAARAVAADMPREVGYPARWRQASLAVELCQRGAEMVDGELPGSYRPGSRASKVRR
jgi:prevent-host-death family protein